MYILGSLTTLSYKRWWFHWRKFHAKIFWEYTILFYWIVNKTDNAATKIKHEYKKFLTFLGLVLEISQITLVFASNLKKKIVPSSGSWGNNLSGRLKITLMHFYVSCIFWNGVLLTETTPTWNLLHLKNNQVLNYKGHLTLYLCWWNISTESIIRPVWFIRYIYYWNLQFLNNVIINKTKVFLPQTYVTMAGFGYHVWFYCSQNL